MEAAGSTRAKNRSTEPPSLPRASRLLPSRSQTRLHWHDAGGISPLQPISCTVLGRMAVRRHHERPAVCGSELHGNVGVRHTQLQQMCRAEVAQLVEVHPRPPECGAQGVPVVQQAALTKLPTAACDE